MGIGDARVGMLEPRNYYLTMYGVLRLLLILHYGYCGLKNTPIL